ncbi:helix-turn-helix domain-containing protein [Rhizobium leguminosarum]|uniref:helix-turn-helix domain-containing protein n=1 Tax=Rhizobium leguminosarum TaxID=384 RepID=UPI001C962901|nr:AraC family transcriptional regulator [Rhizobium leguminosarum]MBY5436142.1 helix-turn-helix transcriptional regulator [Rhizobium leguminosarum]
MRNNTFSSADLPAHLGSDARFSLWRDIYTADIASVELGISDKNPFYAKFEASHIGGLVYAKMTGTINRVTRSRQSILADTHDCYSLVINTSATAIGGTYRQNDIELKPGEAFLDAGEPQTILGQDHNSWIHLGIPKKLLDAPFAKINDKQGLVARHDAEALRLLRNYLMLFDTGDLPASPALTAHVAATIIDLVGLVTGAKRDEAELAGLTGLRAARLEAVLANIRTDFSNPELSAEFIGRKLQLSARYIQDLLAATGSGFSERVLEQRLLRAKTMLSDPRHASKRISEIAYEAGFSDISYFNRCFRRRFGDTPGAVR